MAKRKPWLGPIVNKLKKHYRNRDGYTESEIKQAIGMVKGTDASTINKSWRLLIKLELINKKYGDKLGAYYVFTLAMNKMVNEEKI